VIVDLYGVSNEKFERFFSVDWYVIFDSYVKDRLEANNMTLLNSVVHHFENPVGAVTALYLLGESHLALHTFPENNHISMDCYTCGQCDTVRLVEDLIMLIKPNIVQRTELDRREKM
jgi:S-adenosylmethionine decarboxylase proenzyme